MASRDTTPLSDGRRRRATALRRRSLRTMRTRAPRPSGPRPCTGRARAARGSPDTSLRCSLIILRDAGGREGGRHHRREAEPGGEPVRLCDHRDDRAVEAVFARMTQRRAGGCPRQRRGDATRLPGRVRGQLRAVLEDWPGGVDLCGRTSARDRFTSPRSARWLAITGSPSSTGRSTACRPTAVASSTRPPRPSSG
jgi:hypothetical protein